MARIVIISLLIFYGNTAFSQPWRDSLNAARGSYKSGDYKTSYRQYRSTQKIAPEGIDVSQEAGQAAYRAGKYEEAEKLFSQVEQRRQSAERQSMAENNVGAAKMKAKDLKGAEESFKDALRKNPGNEKARQNLAEVKRLQKQQQQKEQQNQQNQQNQNQQNQNQQNQNQQNQQNQQSQQQQNQQQRQQSGGSEQPVNRNAPKLGDKQTERKLDELMKRERQTKRQMGGNKQTGNGESSSQDW